jgi:hypothetical protein
MKGAQLLQEPSFAKSLAKSPFKASDLPGLSSSIAGLFERLSPQEKASLKQVMVDLEDLSVEQLTSLSNLLAYVAKNPSEYPKLIKQLVASGAFEGKEVPKKYDPGFLAIANSLIGYALVKKMGRGGYAEGGIVSLRKSAGKVKSAGREQDTVLAHISPFEASMLKRMGGKGTTNPETGLPEFGWFSKILGPLLSIGATMVLGAFGVPPIFAGAIGSGAAALVTGAKPADALKSALFGGITSGIMAGFTGSGSFIDNALGNTGTTYSNPIMDKVKEWTGIGSSGSGSLFGGNEGSTGIGPEAATAQWSKDIPMPPVRPGAEEAAALAGAQTSGVTPTVNTPATGGVSSLMDSAKGFMKDPKWPLLIGGGAALLALSNSEKAKDNPQPSLVSNTTGQDLLKADPGKYGFNIENFTPKSKTSPTRVSPVGGYLTSPTGFRYDQFPGGGIMNAKVGGAIDGPGTGTSDSIPARLSDGEFVMTAAAVRGAGNGNRKAGAKKMYDLMHTFERRA